MQVFRDVVRARECWGQEIQSLHSIPRDEKPSATKLYLVANLLLHIYFLGADPLRIEFRTGVSGWEDKGEPPIQYERASGACADPPAGPSTAPRTVRGASSGCPADRRCK